MTLADIKLKFDGLLGSISAPGSTRFSTTVEKAYEALVLADVMREYVRIEGAINTIAPPAAGEFLNQGPGMFRKERSYRIDFTNGKSFYFAANINVFGQNAPHGIKFEADIIVIPAHKTDDVINHFDSYPAPKHLSFVAECKFGQYSKGHLRELLGLRRHLTLLKSSSSSIAAATDLNSLYHRRTLNSDPVIPIKLARPSALDFFDDPTAVLFDLQDIVI